MAFLLAVMVLLSGTCWSYVRTGNVAYLPWIFFWGGVVNPLYDDVLIASYSVDEKIISKLLIGKNLE
jgi:hypothetical protein